MLVLAPAKCLAQDLAFEHFRIPEGLPSNSITAIAQDQAGFMWFGTNAGLVRYDGYAFRTFASSATDSTTLNDNRVRSLLSDRRGYLWVGTAASGVNRFDPTSQTFTRYPNQADGTPMGGDVYALLENATGTIWVGTQAGLFRQQPNPALFEPVEWASPAVTDTIRTPVFSLAEDAAGVLWVGTALGLAYVDTTTQQLHLYDRYPDLDRTPVSALLADNENRLWVGTWGRSLFRLDPSRAHLNHYPYDANDATTVSDSTIRVIYQDRSGTLWFGMGGQEHHGGLNRWNPTTDQFMRFERAADDPTSLGSNRVWALHEDDSGVFWVGTLYGGLHKYDPFQHKFSFVRANGPEGLGNQQAISYYEDRTGTTWMGTWGDGLATIDSTSGQLRYFTTTTHGLQHDRVGPLLEDRHGRFWVGTFGGGLHLFDREQERFAAYRHDPSDTTSLSSDLVMSLLEAADGTLWVGTHQGLNHFDPTTGHSTRYLYEPTLGGATDREQIWALQEDRDGRLWIGTRNGLFRFDSETASFIRFVHDPQQTNSLPEHDIRQILQGRAGLFWIVTRAGHLTPFDPLAEVFTPFDNDSVLQGQAVRVALTDDRGHLWISTEKALIAYDPSTQTTHRYDASDGLNGPDLLFNFAHKTRSGRLFWSHPRGYTTLRPGSIQDNSYPPPVALTGFRVFPEASAHPAALSSAAATATLEQVIPPILRLPYGQNDIEFAFAALHYSQPEHIRYAYTLENEDDGWWPASADRRALYTNLDPGSYVFRVRAANQDGLWSTEGASVQLILAPPWWQTWWFRIVAFILVSSSILGLVWGRERQTQARRHALETEVAHRTAEVMRQRDMLAEQHAQIEAQAEKLRALNQTKSRFFANISHEFRTPLALMLGPIDDALRADAQPVSPAHLRMMQRNGQRLLRLINQLLDLARLEAGKLTLEASKGNLVSFLRGIVFSLESMAMRKGITLQFHDHFPSDQPCYFDPDKLEKAVYNVLSNALKFTPAEGRVDVEITRSKRPTPAARISIRDTGPGIPANALPHIFDRFYQADTSTHADQGTGIGLALARELIHLHGGTLTVESTVGEGSTFTLSLPLGKLSQGIEQSTPLIPHSIVEPPTATLSPVASLPVPEKRPEKESAQPTVLIVDDHPDVRHYLRGHLVEQYHVEEAGTGREALALVQEHAPDLIISDVMMPDMDGLALCTALKAAPTLSHIPVILLTAKADDAHKLEGLELGADDYIYKPFNAEELLLRVENLIAVRRLLKERFTQYVVMQPDASPVSSADAVFLEQVRTTVEAEMGNSHFGVAMLADAIALSERQLHRKIDGLLQVSPAGFIRSMRLQRAAHLLEHRAGTVAEIAYRVGFNNPKYFSRLFRRVYGVSPTAYQKQHPFLQQTDA